MYLLVTIRKVFIRANHLMNDHADNVLSGANGNSARCNLFSILGGTLHKNKIEMIAGHFHSIQGFFTFI